MRTKFYICLLCMALGFFAIKAEAFAASAVSADVEGGYSAIIMDEIVQHWTAAENRPKRATRILVSIDGQGRLKECRIMTKSGSPFADKMVCTAVKKASPFTAPPRNEPIDVYMSFWTGNAVATGKKELNVAPKPASKSDVVAEPKLEQKTVTSDTAKTQAQVRSEQARIIEEAQKSVQDAQAEPIQDKKAQKTVSKADIMPKAAKPEIKTAEKAEAKPEDKTQGQRKVFAGIDYSQPRSTPAGLAPLGELVGTTLPEAEEDMPEQAPEQAPKQEPVETKSKTSTAPEESAQAEEKPISSTEDELLITLPSDSKDDAQPKAPEEAEAENDKAFEEPTNIQEEEISAFVYPQGKEPFIQENRKGQVMDENDYYVEKAIRMLRPLVVYPPHLKAGIVSTALIMNVNAAGAVQGVEVSSSSGNKALDEALLSAAQKVTQLGAHPSGKAQELYLILMVQTPQR